MRTATFPVGGLNFAGCAPGIEKHLGTIQGITRVEASYVSQTVTLTYDEGRMREETLRELVKDCGFACGQAMTPTHLLHAAAEAEREGVPVNLARATADDVAVVANRPAPRPADAAVAAESAPQHAPMEHPRPAPTGPPRTAHP